MTDAAIIAQYEDFMDGQSTLSQALEVQLANNAKNALETELLLEITKEIDTSQVTASGGTYTTPYPLAADWFMPNDTIYINQQDYRQIRRERREIFRDSEGFFYVNYRTKQLFLCGLPQAGQTITVPYFVATPDITTATVQAGNVTTVTWPDRFHSLISMEMARMQYAIDAGDRDRSWAPDWLDAYTRLKSSLVAWDQRLKLAALSYQAPYGQENLPPYSENKVNDY